MTNAGIPFYDAAGTGTATLLRSGYTVLDSVEVENITVLPLYKQLFDAAAAADVILGTTVPTVTRMVPAGAGTPHNTSRLIDIRQRFGLGLVYAVTTTRNGSTAPATAAPLNFNYE